ncbi:MAG: hypothetical protein GXP26_09695 [Planctomycetes bacterium]|nr:hypothetical protein [Planctomycetota bacterium]
MSMPTSPTRLLTCDACGATLPFEPEHAGMKCRCGGCGKILTVPGEEEEKEEKEPAPKYVSFVCRVCQTILSARVEHVGRKTKCPDCYALTEVPPPPKAKKKRIPDAMHGQQYGLWGVDEAPSSEELTARLPKFFPVYCRLCNTLMHAQPKQVGMKLKCPDCGVKTLVVEPPPKRPAASVMVPDGEEYQIDEAATPGPRPVPVPPALVEGKSRAVYREKLQEEYGKRSKIPRLPTVQGVFSMLVRPPIPTWWLGLSCALTAAVLLGAMVLNSAGGGFDAIMALCFFAMGCIIGVLWFSANAALWCSILTDSSEGNDRLFNTPSAVPHEWLGEMLFVGLSLAVSIIPGWAIGTVISNQGISIGLSMLLCFPIALLSALERGSPIEVISIRILKSLVRRPALWLLLYLQIAALAGICVWIGTKLVPDYLYFFCPIAIAASLLYFRLLGRFAWWLAESMPAEDGG